MESLGVHGVKAWCLWTFFLFSISFFQGQLPKMQFQNRRNAINATQAASPEMEQRIRMTRFQADCWALSTYSDIVKKTDATSSPRSLYYSTTMLAKKWRCNWISSYCYYYLLHIITGRLSAWRITDAGLHYSAGGFEFFSPRRDDALHRYQIFHSIANEIFVS